MGFSASKIYIGKNSDSRSKDLLLIDLRIYKVNLYNTVNSTYWGQPLIGPYLKEQNHFNRTTTIYLPLIGSKLCFRSQIWLPICCLIKRS